MYTENFISKKLRTFAEKNDWLISGDYIYGKEQDYLFTGMDSKKQKVFITPVPGITDDQQEDLFEILEKNKKTMRLDNYEITDDFLCIRIGDSSTLKSDDIDFIIALLVGALQEVSIVSKERCQECKNMGADKTEFLYDLYCYMHEDCSKQVREDSANGEDTGEEDKDEESEDGEKQEEEPQKPKRVGFTETSDNVSVTRKILFTVFGAVIGSIPWLILPFVMDLVNDVIRRITTSTLVSNFTHSLLICICAYLVSYFALVGYKLSGSRFTMTGRKIVGIVSIVAVIILQFVNLAILIAKEPFVELNFSNYVNNLTQSTFYLNMLLGGAIGIIFALILVLPFFDNEKPSKKKEKVSTNKDEISDEDSLKEDATPEKEDSEKE